MTWGTHCSMCGREDCGWAIGEVCEGRYRMFGERVFLTERRPHRGALAPVTVIELADPATVDAHILSALRRKQEVLDMLKPKPRRRWLYVLALAIVLALAVLFFRGNDILPPHKDETRVPHATE